MEEKNDIGNRIKMLREHNGFTQKELAIKLGLKGETAIANYESGYSTPKDNIKLKMCEIFDCSLDYLMCKTDIKNQTQQVDFLELTKLGFNINNYNPPSEKQKEQIRDLLEIILKENKK